MTSATRACVILGAAAGLIGATAFAPSAEAQSRRHGRRIVYVRHTGHGWYGYPYSFGDPFYTSLHRPYWAPRAFPHAYALGTVDMNAAGIHGVGAVELNAKPGQAEVWVDGTFVAEARELDGYPSLLWLKEGAHRVVVYREGYVNFDEEIDVRRGLYKELKVRLQKGQAASPGPRPGTSARAGEPR